MLYTKGEVLKAQPFVKWVGGKRQLLPQILALLPLQMNTYFEPFVGGGALLLELANRQAFQQAIINDSNTELTNCSNYFKTSDIEALVALLQTYPYERTFFENLRAQQPQTLLAKVARFLYLNRTCFNGLYRVNSKDQFNVPFGSYKNPTICDPVNFEAVHQALQNVVVHNGDFTGVTATANVGDVVYFDPPYIPISDTANFTSYTANKFDMASQQTLANVFTRLANKGVAVLLSNSDTPTTRELYTGFNFTEVQARRNVNSKGTARGTVGELLIHANLAA